MHRSTMPAYSILLGALLGALAACQRTETGKLVVRWHVTVPTDTSNEPCSVAGIQHVALRVARGREVRDSDPSYVFSCSDGEATLTLEEGLYTVAVLVVRRDATEPETVAVFQDVEVLAGAVRDWAGPYPPDPPDAHDIELPWCGNGLLEGREECDTGAALSDLEPDACRTDCRNPECGDGVKDSDEACDASDLGGQSCTTLGYAAGDLRCTDHCTLDESGCLPPRAPLTLLWSFETQEGTPLASCDEAGVVTVHYLVASDAGHAAAEGLTECSAGQAEVPDLPFGTYDVRIEGLDWDGRAVASGMARNHRHENIDGSSVQVRLVASPQ